MFRRRLFQWMLPVVVLVGLGLAASAPADPESPRILAKQRLELAQEANDAIKAAIDSKALGRDSEQVRRWSRRLMEAKVAMSEKKADQVAAINAYLLRMKELEKLAKEGHRAGEVGNLKLLDAKWHVLEAESLLSQAKAEEGAR